jgi:hypothetical protein
VASRAQLFQDEAPKVVKGKAKEAREAVQAAAPSISLPSVGFNPSLLALPGADAHTSASSIVAICTD